MGKKKIRWNQEDGTILLLKEGKEERLILMRKGFMDAFFDEIEKIEGRDALMMTIRMLLEKLEAKKEGQEKPGFDAFTKFNDEYVLPVSIEEGNIPDFLKWDGKSRCLTGIGSSILTVYPLNSMMTFKEVMADVLTDRGRDAILRNVSKKAGIAVGEKAQLDYGWKEFDSALMSLYGLISFLFPLLGWGRTSFSTKIGPDGNHMIFFKVWNSYESHCISSTRPACVIFLNYIEGIAETVSLRFSGKPTESKEVKCTSMGDDYCALAIKQKEKDSPRLDWKELEAEWRVLDNMDIQS